jgi:hypothetical protein
VVAHKWDREIKEAKRSNVETAFSMINAKFSGSVRSKTPVAQVNETLAKVLCHNIRVLISIGVRVAGRSGV